MEISRPQQETTGPTVENPLLALPAENVQFLKFLRGIVTAEPEENERSLTPRELGTKRFVGALLANGTADRIPGVSAEELRGLDVSPKDDEGKAELARIGRLVGDAMGTDPSVLIGLANDARLKGYLDRLPNDRKNVVAELIRGYWKRMADDETGVAAKLADELGAGSRPSEEIAPMPAKGEFAMLDDRDPKEPGNPVRVYQQQIVRTSRDVESPGFSSCAAVVLYRERPDGTPEDETIFAHLPPKAYGEVSGRDPDFDDYTPDFLKKLTGVESFAGYKARISAGLRLSPERIAVTLRSMGASVEEVRQIPMDMYAIRLDARTKTMVAKGFMERVTRPEERATYKTVEGVPITIDTRFEETVSV